MCGIYKIKNLIDGKVYIGKSINIQKRFRAHINDSFNENKSSYNHLIHKAIRKYGVENFSFDIIEQCCEEVLNEREIYWISFYDCCVLDGRDKGYNMTRGGDGSFSINVEEIYTLWDAGFSIKEIADQLHHDRHMVSTKLKEYKNYTKEENNARKYNLISKSRQKEVRQYDLSGNVVGEYESIFDASEKTGIGYGTIRSNVQDKTASAGGFQWRYKDAPPPGKYNVKGNGYKTAIVQLDLQYNFIQEFQTLKEAAQEVGLASTSSLSYALQDLNRTVRGYHWMRKSDYVLFCKNDTKENEGEIML